MCLSRHNDKKISFLLQLSLKKQKEEPELSFQYNFKFYDNTLCWRISRYLINWYLSFTDRPQSGCLRGSRLDLKSGVTQAHSVPMLYTYVYSRSSSVPYRPAELNRKAACITACGYRRDKRSAAVFRVVPDAIRSSVMRMRDGLKLSTEMLFNASGGRMSLN